MLLRRASAAHVALAGGIAAYALLFSGLAVLRHRAFSTGRFDLGNMVQAVWSTAEGRPLEVTGGGGEQFVRLGAHVDPILVLLAPVWRLWPQPELLLVLQATLVPLGAVPVFLLACRHLRSERAALAFAAAYLLSPALAWTTLADFHPVALAAPLLAFAFWALDDDRLLLFAAFALLAVATKEHVALLVAGLGAWYALARGRRLVGGATAALGLAWALVAVTVVVPHFHPAGRSSFHGRYDTVGGTPGGMLRTAVTDPGRVLGEALDERGVTYVLQLLAPLAGLPLLAPLAALAAAPELALNLLSSAETQTSIRHHYSAAALGVLFPAAVLGAARLARDEPRRATWAAGLAVALSAGAAYLLGPLPPAGTLPAAGGIEPAAIARSEHDRVAAQAVALVPAGVPVSASNSLGAHLSDRRRVHVFPGVWDARWVVVDRREPGYVDAVLRARAPRVLAALSASAEWRTVLEQDGVVVLRRRHR